jgi:hypothetical protein
MIVATISPHSSGHTRLRGVTATPDATGKAPTIARDTNFRGASVEVTPDGHVTRIRLLPDNPAEVAPAPSATSARRAHRLPGLSSHAPGTPATGALTEPARRCHPRAIRLTVKTPEPAARPWHGCRRHGSAGIAITG